MNKCVLSIVFIFSVLIGIGQIDSTLTPKQIIEKSEEKVKGGVNAYTEMTINIVRPSWNREMKLKSWAKGNAYSMILITAPARDKGQVFLKNKKQVWSYIPKFNKVSKLPPTAMSQSWMGTDLSNDDLVQESSKAEDFKYTKLADTIIDGLNCYQLELIPNEGTNVIWGKIKLFIDKKDFITVRNEMYDEDNVLVNVLKASQIKVLDGVKMATKMEMIPMEKPGHKTIMTITKLDVKNEIPDTFFTKQNMKRVK